MSARAESGIHPVTGPAFFDADEANALDFEFGPNQLSQVSASDKSISPRVSRPDVRQAELALEIFKNIEREEGDLAFVILFVVEVAISPNAASGNTLDLSRFENRVFTGRSAVVPNKIVAGRSE